MKIFNRTIYLLLLTGLLTSCSDVVEFNQPGNLPAGNAITSVAEMNTALGGLYENLDERDTIYFTSVFTDEITIGPGNGGQGLDGQYQFLLNEISPIASTAWNESYSSINEINRYLTAAQDISPSEGQQNTYDDLIGQAYAMRAYEYFILLGFYSADLTDDSSLGVITYTDVPDPLDQRPRSTTGETFDQILSDIEMAESLLDTDASTVTRFTLPALTALRARIATYRKNYAEAESRSQELLDQFSLAGPDQYLDMFWEDTQGEVIFKLLRVQNGPYDQQPAVGTPAGTGWIGGTYAQVSVTQGAHYQVDSNLYNLYDSDDIRAEVTTLDGDDGDGSRVLYVTKYPGIIVPLHNDQKIFRASEMALINAEAKVAQGDLIGAALMIQSIRSARSTSNTDASLPVYTSQQEGYAGVLLERRKELAFEGHRWHDLGRIGAAANARIDRAPDFPGAGGCAQYEACEGPIPGQSEKYVIPIPLSEINANDEIEQNPGY